MRRAAQVFLGGVALIALVSLVGAGGRVAHPPDRRPWTGPAPGGVWTRTTLTLQTNALVAAPRHPAVLFAGTDDGVWRSGDGGVRWTRGGAGLRGKEVDALAASPGNGALFAGAADGAVYALAADGVAWRRVSPPLGANPVYSLSADGRGTVLAGTAGALYRGAATPRGWRWRRVARTGDAAVTSIAWSSSAGGRAFASVFGVWPPVLTTFDGGRTWRAAAAGLPPVLPTQALLALAPRGAEVILTTMGGGVWEWSGGGPWRDISAGLPARHAMPLAALPGSATMALYAGTMGDGVYVRQGSAAWRPLGRGLTGVDNTILALGVAAGPARSAPTLLAGTANGVFRYAAARR